MKRMMAAMVALVLLAVFSACAEEINIESLDISFKVPEHIEWATRTEGNYGIMQDTYNMNREALIAYMKSANEYFKGVDPTTDLRILVTSEPVAMDEMNYSSKSNESILLVGEGIVQALGGRREDISVHEAASGNKFLKLHYQVSGQTMCLGSTCVDGNQYTVIVRGTNIGYLDTMLSYIMETFKVNADLHIKAEQTVSIAEAVFTIPGNWEKETFVVNPDIENVCYTARGSDGLGRCFTCNVMDVCALMGWTDTLRPILSGDLYSEEFTIPLAAQQNVAVEDIRGYTYGGKKYYGYPATEDGVPGIRMCIVENGYMYFYIFESLSSGDLFQDEYYPVFESILNSVEYR